MVSIPAIPRGAVGKSRFTSEQRDTAVLCSRFRAVSLFYPRISCVLAPSVHDPPQNPFLRDCPCLVHPGRAQTSPLNLKLCRKHCVLPVPRGRAVTAAFAFPLSGFLRGEHGAQPQLIAFHPCFKKGALLTVVSAVPGFGSSFPGSPSLSLRGDNPVAEPGGWKNPTASPWRGWGRCPCWDHREDESASVTPCRVLYSSASSHPLPAPVLVHGEDQPRPLLLCERPRPLRQPQPQPRHGHGQRQRAGAASLLRAVTTPRSLMASSQRASAGMVPLQPPSSSSWDARRGLKCL